MKEPLIDGVHTCTECGGDLVKGLPDILENRRAWVHGDMGLAEEARVEDIDCDVYFSKDDNWQRYLEWLEDPISTVNPQPEAGEEVK